MLMQFVNCIWCSDTVCEVHFQIVGDAVAVQYFTSSCKPGQRNVYKDVLYLTHTMQQKTFEILEIWVHGSRFTVLRCDVDPIKKSTPDFINLDIAGKFFKLEEDIWS